jgi:hypothetical protein
VEHWEVQWADEPSLAKAEGYLIKTMAGAGIISGLGRAKTKEACDSALARVRNGGEKASEVVFSEVSKLFSAFPVKQRQHKFAVLSTFIDTEVMR